MFSRDENKEGVFVLNGQIYSITDVIKIMQRHGIHLRQNHDGLFIDGERISSISDLNDNKCPLARTCEKRVALVEFLKLQKQNLPDNNFQQRLPDQYQIRDASNDHSFSRNEEPRRDFIKPNNHDLFEGNISDNSSSRDDAIDDIRKLFDGPDIFSNDDQYEEPFYSNDEFQDSRSSSRDRDYINNQNLDYNRNIEQPFCAECGFDLNPNWNTCPNCGYKIIKKNIASEKFHF